MNSAAKQSGTLDHSAVEKVRELIENFEKFLE